MSWLTACRTASSWQVVRHSLSQPSLGVSAVNEQRQCWDRSSELKRLSEAFHIPGERRSAWNSITTQHATARRQACTLVRARLRQMGLSLDQMAVEQCRASSGSRSKPVTALTVPKPHPSQHQDQQCHRRAWHACYSCALLTLHTSC